MLQLSSASVPCFLFLSRFAKISFLNVAFFFFKQVKSSENFLCKCSFTLGPRLRLPTRTFHQVLQGLVERCPVQSSALHILQKKRPQFLRRSPGSLLQPPPFIRPRQAPVPGQKRSQNPAQTAGRLHPATGHAAPRFPTHPEGAARSQPRGPGPESPGPPQHPPRRTSSSDAHLWPQASGSGPEKALVFRARQDERDRCFGS